MEEREPKLGVAVGRKGCGKTYQTTLMIKKYIVFIIMNIFQK